ncbi:MAG: hypothetical protein ACSLE0_23315 [Chitinophagaceae bacterium]
MEEVKNVTHDEVLELVKDFPITPLRNKVIITTNVEKLEDDEINLQGGAFSPEQFVLAVGSYAKDYLSPGQKINLDLEAMTVRVPNSNDAYEPMHKIMLKPVEIDGRVYGIITEDKIEYLINN